MASTTATPVAAKVEGTRRQPAVTAVAAPNRKRSHREPSIGQRLVFFVSLLASTVAAFQAQADSRSHATQAPLQVSVNVVSTCSIDSQAAYSVNCPRFDVVMIQHGEVRSLHAGESTEAQYSLNTVNF